MGTLSQKIHCHEKPSTTAPPTTGPRATPSPDTPDQMPSARPRLSAAKASLSSVSDSGVITAAPRPCRALGRDQRVRAGRDGGRGGRDREYAEAGGEDTPAAEPVTERRAGQ